MKPNEEQLDPPLDQAELEKIPTVTLSKNMRNLEDILADIVADPNVNLDPNEQRLVDRHLFEKTGKHFGKFKNPKKSKVKSMPVISSRPDGRGQKELDQPKIPVRKDVPIGITSPAVSAGALSNAIS